MPGLTAQQVAAWRRDGFLFPFPMLDGAPQVRPVGAHRTAAVLVRGIDRYGHFEPVTVPAEEFHPDAVAAHRRAVSLYSRTYREQEALHRGAFAPA